MYLWISLNPVNHLKWGPWVCMDDKQTWWNSARHCSIEILGQKLNERTVWKEYFSLTVHQKCVYSVFCLYWWATRVKICKYDCFESFLSRVQNHEAPWDLPHRSTHGVIWVQTHHLGPWWCYLSSTNWPAELLEVEFMSLDNAGVVWCQPLSLWGQLRTNWSAGTVLGLPEVNQ